MKKVIMVIFSAVMGLGIMIVDITYVSAQDTTDEFTLEEITVTAQKREENQQKVPIAMEVISGEEIKELGKNDIEQILGNISSAIVNKAGSNLRISLRGISDDQPENRVQVSSPTVAVNMDGVMSNRQQSGQGLYDIERVEVLYGPQSTLYASSTPGGIVNIVSATPKTDKFEASGTLELGNYNLKHIEGAVNAPVIDTIALRAAVSMTKRNGYLTNGGDDEDSKSARLRALYKPSDKFSFLVTGEITKVTNYGFGGVTAFINQDDVDEPWTSAEESAGNARKQTQKKIYGTMNLDINFATLTITPSYSKSSSPSDSSTEDPPGSGNIVTSVGTRDNYEKGIEVRMASSEDFFFKWITGIIWYKSLDEMTNDSSNGSYNRMHNLQQTKAFYGNVTYPVTDQLRLTGGFRITNDKNDSYNLEYPPRPGRTVGEAEITHMKYTNPDLKIGMEYDINESSMLYSDLSSSYRTQGMAYDAEGNTFPAEELRSFTVGAKNRFLENRLQVNIAAFYYDYKNYLAVGGAQYVDQKDLNGDGDYDDTGLYDESIGGTRDETIIQDDDMGKTVGDVYEYGVDLQTSTIITEKDKLDLSISYLNSKFKKLFFDFMDITNSQGIADLDYEGKGKTYSPHWTITASYSHNFSLWNGGVLTTRIDARFKSKFFMTWKEEALAIDETTYEPMAYDLRGYRDQESFVKGDFSATYAHPTGTWNLTGYVKNLTNYAEKTSYIVMGGGRGTMMIGSPRTYGGVLSVKF